jgi:hypothetical protein
MKTGFYFKYLVDGSVETIKIQEKTKFRALNKFVENVSYKKILDISRTY